jgi:hypothetical protein
MFVKLSFSANKSFNHIRQILNAIINDTGINSVAALNTAAASWNAAIVAGLDYSTSEIIRTAEPTTVKSHLADNNATYGWPVWTLEFQVYDTPAKKYYISFNPTVTGVSTNNSCRIQVGDTIASGSMDSNQASMSVDLDTSANTSGTPVILSTTAPAQSFIGGAAGSAKHQYDSGIPNNSTNIRTFWMYLTNDCLIVAHTGVASSNLGFNATYTDASAYTGPYIFSQYTRYDYHNTNANGVIPLMFTNHARILNNSTAAGQGLGFGTGIGTTADWNRVENVNAASNTDTAFRVFNMIDAHPQVGSSWPLMSFPQVNWGSGSRTNETSALTTKSTLNTTSLANGQVPRVIHTTAGVRWPSSDLRTLGYAMLPLRWSNSYRGNLGGNASQRGGFYIFNGDYFPGDTFVHGGKTYIILPTFRGYTDRVGIAVPKE